MRPRHPCQPRGRKPLLMVRPSSPDLPSTLLYGLMAPENRVKKHGSILSNRFQVLMEEILRSLALPSAIPESKATVFPVCGSCPEIGSPAILP